MRQHNIIWKKKGAALAPVLVSCGILLGGCSGNKLVETTAETTAESTAESVAGNSTQLPNPMVEVEDPQAFEEIGVHMIEPAGGEEFTYFIISGEVAQMQFTKDGAVYTWRASDTAEDFAGIFERFKEEVITAEYTDGTHSAQIEIKTTDSGGRLASWAWGSTRYTLYTADEVTDTAVKDVALELAQLSQNEK